MFLIHELVGQERGKGLQVSPSKLPCEFTLPLFRIFAYLCLLPLWLHMDHAPLCLSKTAWVVPSPKSKNPTKPKALPLSLLGAKAKHIHFWSGGEAASLQWLWPSLMWVGGYLTVLALWIDWLGSRFCKWEGSSCPLWHAGRSISGQLAAFFFPQELLHAVPCCCRTPPSSVPREGKGLGAHQQYLTGTGKASLSLLNLHITGD